MKKIAFIGLSVTIAVIVLLIFLVKGCSDCSCCDSCICEDTCHCDKAQSCTSSCTCNEAVKEDTTKMPLNISVYLDLSDRLIQEMAPMQADRDTSIIMYIAEKLKERAVKQKIVGSRDHLKIFFYPSPNDPMVNKCAEKLDFDLSNMPNPKDKRERLLAFQKEFRESLSQIYETTLDAGNWIGSDIWGFFKKPVDSYCIRKGYRNILVILTDGYIYHVANKQQDGNAYTYILPQTLADPNSSLMVGRNGLEELEVLVLEINPKDPKQEPKMESVILDWLHAMGVRKAYVGDTDIPKNTTAIIDKFFDYK